MVTNFLRGIALACTLEFATALAEEGDVGRGSEVYRACAGCHSLEPGVHLGGPSLANLWAAAAGKVEGYVRYSSGLEAADFAWDEDTLNAWLYDPQAMIAGTYMAFPGIQTDRDRADLISFLELALAPDGATSVVEQGYAPVEIVRGQQLTTLVPTPDNARVTAIRHCGDGYFIATANGVETPHWEKNVRLKIDSQATGPTPGVPVIVGAGMRGDRFSVIFSSVDELKSFVVEKC